MNTSFYIAKKLGGEKRSGSRVNRLTSLIAIGSVALSIAAMILSLSILGGFQREIRRKVTGFSGQAIISSLGAGMITDEIPIDTSISYLSLIRAHADVSHVQFFAHKGGLIKTDEAIQGVMMKGVGKDFDPSFFADCLTEGRLPAWNDSIPSMEILVSKRLASALKLSVHQPVLLYFIDETVRLRQFTVSGIYDATLEEIDKTLVLGDIRIVQRLNGWTGHQVSGIELFLTQPDQMDRVIEEIEEMANQNGLASDSPIAIRSIKDTFSHIFDWLGLMDTNVLILIVLMFAVSGVNMVSGLLILLFEKISMIGLLKALGMKNKNIRAIFFYRSAALVLKGMIIGNVLGVTSCFLQKTFGIIKLDPVSYMVSQIPIDMNFTSLLLMNVVAFAAMQLLLQLPTLMITRVRPDKSLRVR